MIVRVTQEHIREGKRGECGECPVALALVEAFETHDVSVFDENWDWYLEVAGKTIKAPDEVVSFARAFDNKYPVEPFEFEVPELPKWKYSEEPSW